MTLPPAPVLIACAHGTRSSEGQARINAVRTEMRALRSGLDVREAYVDVQEPELPDVVAGLPEGVSGIVVPLLLSVGYHVRVDIARAVASRPGMLAAEPLGPDPLLARLLQERLAEVPREWGVVLAAAGSSEPDAARSVAQLAGQLTQLRPSRVLAAYGASAAPSVPEAVGQLRRDGARHVAIASYLLAPGYFHDQLAKAGADMVTEPLLPSPVIARLALERYDQALASSLTPTPAAAD